MFSKTDLAAAPYPVREPVRRWYVNPTWVFLLVAAAAVAGVQYGNSRLLGSWHGFLHSAIANRFSTFSFPPENPFFAGETLPYYWFYQFIGYWISRALQLDLLHSLHLFSGICLALFVIFSERTARACFRSKLAGATIAFLALAGINPLGPAIALTKHFVNGVPLVERAAGPLETTFVPDQMADDLMTHPLLPAMYVGSDWHYGQNIVWFFDIGARAPALAMLMAVLYLIVKPGGGWRRHLAMAVTSALTTAFSPVIGMGVAGTLFGVAVILAAVAWRGNSPELTGRLVLVALSGACLAGTILALPTYFHMFFRLSGGAGISLKQGSWFYVAMVSANAALLFPLAVAGVRKTRDEKRSALLTLTIAGALLLLFVAFVHLPEGNEHSLSNAAYCLLAIPAAAVVNAAGATRLSGWRRDAFVAVLLLLVCLPMTAATFVAFGTRSPMPISTSGTALVRLPAAGDFQQFYEWVRRQTPQRSIFITDPRSPAKMSGNVSELPAFTSRTLFTDTPNYLTIPNLDAAFRAKLAVGAVAGEALSAQQLEYLARFGRPVYVVTYQREAVPSLSGLYSPPVFHQGIVAAFHIAGRLDAR